MSRRLPVLALLRRRLWAACVLLSTLGALHAEPLVLDGRPAVPVWPAVRLLADPGHSFTAPELAVQPQRFEAPTGTPGNLGRRDETLWLRVPVHVPGVEPLRRVFEIDYPTGPQCRRGTHQARRRRHVRRQADRPPPRHAQRARAGDRLSDLGRQTEATRGAGAAPRRGTGSAQE